MTEVIVFPDVEKLLTDWLPAQLADYGHAVHVGTSVPNPRPAIFVRILATGGQRNNLVQDAPTVVYEAWAAKETDAVTVAQLTRALIVSLAGQTVGGVMVYRVNEFASPASLPDPLSSQTRYTGTVSILLRGYAQ